MSQTRGIKTKFIEWNLGAKRDDVLAVRYGNQFLLAIDLSVQMVWLGALKAEEFKGNHTAYRIFPTAELALKFRDDTWEEWEKKKEEIVALVMI